MGWLTNSVTGKDNKTHDIVRIAIAVVTLMLPAILVFGIFLETCAFFMSKPFDMNAFFLGIGGFLTLFGAFLTGSATAILLKKTTEPDGSTQDVEKMTTGTQPDHIKINETTIVHPDNQL